MVYKPSVGITKKIEEQVSNRCTQLFTAVALEEAFCFDTCNLLTVQSHFHWGIFSSILNR